MRLEACALLKIGTDLGIPMMGFLDAAPLTAALPYLKTRFGREGMPPFTRLLPEVRIDPCAYWPQTKAVIVIGLPYEQCFFDGDVPVGYGLPAAFCKGRDYHCRMTDKLNELAARIKAEYGHFEYRCVVDNSALVDRAAAWQGGLGFYGKNNCLINPEYGSAFNIGQLLIDQPINFKAVEPMTSRCGECRKCLNACPNQALGDGNALDASRCIAYLTQKKKLTSEESGRISKYLFGCDECQRVCPYNRQKNVESCENRFNNLLLDLSEIAAMDEAQYQTRFSDTNMAWRGLNILKRNAEILKEQQK